tara:strand:- start:703 stop:2124 length:1422 start_codon:yes stop_codon:yes gene_type:complete
MSQTLKRPMFRKGGPVMEGIMDGIVDRQQMRTGGPVDPRGIFVRGATGPGVSTNLPVVRQIGQEFRPTRIVRAPTYTGTTLPAVIQQPVTTGGKFFRAGQMLGRGIRATRAGIAAGSPFVPLGIAAASPFIADYAAEKAREKGEYLREGEIIDPETGKITDIGFEFGMGDFSQQELAKDDNERLQIKRKQLKSRIKRNLKIDEDEAKKVNIDPETGKDLVDPRTLGKGKGKDTGLGELGIEGQLEKSLNEYLPAIESALQVDEETTKRKLFLELAKFGASLAAQPGGSLTRAIGKAAEKPLEGVARVISDKDASKRQAKLIAIQAALRDMAPGDFAKRVEDVRKVYDLPNTKEGIKEAAGVLEKLTRNDSTALSREETALRKQAEDLRIKGPAQEAYVRNLREMKKDYPDLVGKFNKVITSEQVTDLKDLKDKEYYILPSGDFVRLDKKNEQFIYPGEPGFEDVKKVVSKEGD